MSNGLFHKKMTERTYFAEKATKAKSESTLDVRRWMFDAYSPPEEDSKFKPLRAGINPDPTHEAHLKK